MRPTFDRRLWILLFWYIILLQCIHTTNQQNLSYPKSSSITIGQNSQELVDINNHKITNNSTSLLLESKYEQKFSKLVFPLCVNCNLRLLDNSLASTLRNNKLIINNLTNIVPRTIKYNKKSKLVGNKNIHIRSHQQYNNKFTSLQNDDDIIHQRTRHHQEHNGKNYILNQDKTVLTSQNNEKSLLISNKKSYRHRSSIDNFSHFRNSVIKTTTVQSVPSQLPSTNSVNLQDNTESSRLHRIEDITSPLPPDNSLLRPPHAIINNINKIDNQQQYLINIDNSVTSINKSISDIANSSENLLKLGYIYNNTKILNNLRRLAKRNIKNNKFDEILQNNEENISLNRTNIKILTDIKSITNGTNNNSQSLVSSEENQQYQNDSLFSSSDIRKSDIRYNKTFKQQKNQSFSTFITTNSSTFSSSQFPSIFTTPSNLINSSTSISSLLNSQLDISSSNEKIVKLPSSPPLQKMDVSNISYSNTDNNMNLNKLNININNNNNNKYIKIDENIKNNYNIKKLNNKIKIIGDKISLKRKKIHEPIVIIDEAGEEFDSGLSSGGGDIINDNNKNINDDYQHDEPFALPLRPIIRGPYDEIDSEEMSIVYAEQHSEVKLMCEVDLDIETSEWLKNGQKISVMERTSIRVTDYRFIKEPNGGLTINNVMLEDDGKWQCKAENSNGYSVNARSVKLVVLDRPKPPYLLIDSRRLDAGNIFVPVKENSELSLACISEGGNPKPTLTWEVLLSPGVDRHSQKVAAEVLELEEINIDNKDKEPYKINSGAKSEARLPAVYRAHHNARILCVMEHPTLKIRQNASLLLDVQYTPSFAISRTPGFGYPLREGIEVSLKCDVDSNPSSTPRWQKDDSDTPVPQIGDGFLNFTSIRREHSGWYKCTSRHLNFQYSSIGYYLSVRYDSVDVTSEPDDQEVSVAAASHNPNKGQLEVQLGGAVTLQCPQGSLGCWSHLDPVTAKLRGLGYGLSTPTGQFSLKDVVYQDAGTYKCIGQSPTNKKKLEVLQTVGVTVKGTPSVMARNATPVAYPGSPLHLSVEFCANPAAHAARWLHGDRVYTPGNQYGSTVLAYGVTDLPTPFCKEARLTYVSMHERVPRIFYFIVSSPGGVAETIFKVNFTLRYRTMSNSIDDEEEELAEPEEIHFPVFGSSTRLISLIDQTNLSINNLFMLKLCIIIYYLIINVCL